MQVFQNSSKCIFFYRYNLPILIIVVNNNGIYTGLDADTWKEMSKFGDLATWWAPSKYVLLIKEEVTKIVILFTFNALWSRLKFFIVNLVLT